MCKMALEMKVRCEKCTSALKDEDDVFICTHECTFCETCAVEMKKVCPNCQGELVIRPKSMKGTI